MKPGGNKEQRTTPETQANRDHHITAKIKQEITGHDNTEQRKRHITSQYKIHHTLSDTRHSVGLLWTSDRCVADNTHLQDEIRTRIPSKQAAADPRLRPRGQTQLITPLLTGRIIISVANYTFS